mgnify:CR=1 FL=1
MRDPKVWKDGDGYYMMTGSSYHDAGRVLFYTSKDGENWTYANQCRTGSYGWTIECPDLFSQNGSVDFYRLSDASDTGGEEISGPGCVDAGGI